MPLTAVARCDSLMLLAVITRCCHALSIPVILQYSGAARIHLTLFTVAIPNYSLMLLGLVRHDVIFGCYSFLLFVIVFTTVGRHCLMLFFDAICNCSMLWFRCYFLLLFTSIRYSSRPLWQHKAYLWWQVWYLGNMEFVFASCFLFFHKRSAWGFNFFIRRDPQHRASSWHWSSRLV